MNSQSQDRVTDKILARLQEFPERQLTFDVLIPLLRTFGFDKVEHHGGPYEEGKDLICWRTDELGLIELAVAQVKKYQPTAKSSDEKSFSEVVTQLQQAAERAVPNTDGTTYFPALIYFITPFPVETRALQSRFEGYSSLKPRRVKIIDGPLLAKLIRQNLPNLAKTLSGSEPLVHDAMVKTLTNAELLSALSTKSHQDISSFYCDLDFGVGRISTRFFFSLDFKPNVLTCSLSSLEWPAFKTTCQFAESIFGLRLVSQNYEKIEEEYKKQKADHKNKLKLDNRITAEIANNFSRIMEIEDRLQEQAEALQSISTGSFSNRASQAFQKIVSELFNMRNRAQKGQREEDRWKQHKNIILKHLDVIKSVEPKLFEKSQPAISEYLRVLKKTIDLEQQRKTLESVYKITIEGHELAKILKEKQEWLALQIKNFNKNKPPILRLREFLRECEKLFEQVEKILADWRIGEAVGISRGQKYTSLAKFRRITLPVHSIFDTGLNVAVLGEAGAGKTTTLQMYAKRRLEKEAESEITIFVPLARVVATLTDEDESKQTDNPLVKLERGISSYFCTLGLNITPSMLIDMFRQKKVLVLLDGIDEAIKRAPWILGAIRDLSERYTQIQIIVSSRMSGEYLQKIPFFGITLLPFTDKQRERFIKGWFEGRSKSKVTQILNHLNQFRDLNDIIRNPLLATILCVLADHDVPLPDSEVRLYEERMRLLLWQYDIHKKAVRLNSLPHHLELVARKVGYILHKAGTRYAEPDFLVNHTVSALGDKLSREQIDLAFTELVDPCNILVSMTDDGQLGFGHLRYQEYLVACELKNNRGIPVGPLMSQSWWRGVLTLFAQMTDEIEFIIDWAIKRGEISAVYETLEAMLSVRPEQEKAALREIIGGHLRLDQLEIGSYPNGLEKFDEETKALLDTVDVNDNPDLQ